MSVDVLFTEAAEAGGPPGFTEDDIERRVGGRRRRRRGLAGAAAVVVVVAGGVLGVRLASQDPADEVVAGPSTEEVSIVSFDEASLVGEWTALDPTDRIDGDVTVAFDADGGYVQGGCNGASGQWLVTRGHLTIGPGISTTKACPGTGLQAADTAFAGGVPTLYSDGLLRFATAAFTLDFVRDDDPTPPDPGAARPPAPTPVPTDGATVAGRWVVADVNPDGSPVGGSLALADDGTLEWDGCGSGTGHWAIDHGKVVLRNVVDQSAVDCAYEPGHPLLDQVLHGRAVYTDDDQLLLIDDVGTIALRRAEPATGPLTGVRWVATGPLVEPYALAPWIELSDDGTYTAQAACGQSSGDWTRTGDDLTFRFTGRDLPACPEEYLIVEEAIEGITSGRLVGDELIIDFDTPDVVFRRYEDLGAVPTDGQLSGRWQTDGAGTPFFVEADASLHLPPCDDVIDSVQSACAGIDPLLMGWEFSALRIDGDVLYLWGDDVVARVQRATPGRDSALNDAEQLLAGAVARMGVEGCCGEPSHGSPVATSGFVHEGVEVSVVAGPVGSVEGYIPFTGVEAVLDQRATFSQADGRIMVGFACDDLVVAVSPSLADYPGDAAVIVAAAERLIDALPCTARPVGLP